ncbi:putative ribonuclease H-like domain-containing protein [Rosa chinensis]|uniref:Putative ribonuclease H-like domain-containing protein n=1 Tax=Rosa chinensis TaxID=74649 RepID=A0A2P6PMM4_ROSCH|nr:putative ribonuclease H-like domain-containing protein [Rosa chinensis]
MFNNVQELCVIKRMGAICKPRWAPRIIEVNWLTPPFGWIKVNTDGAWKMDSNQAGYGGVYRDYKGLVIGAFSSTLDIPSSVAAEVMAVIKAIELAWVRDWKYVWLEVNSSLILIFSPFSSSGALEASCAVEQLLASYLSNAFQI